MKTQAYHSKPLSEAENDALLRFLNRVVTSTKNESIRRVAKSLFNLLSRERYEHMSDGPEDKEDPPIWWGGKTGD